LLQISISQNLLGDFCNRIGPDPKWQPRRQMSDVGARPENICSISALPFLTPERKFGGALRDDTRCSVTPLREVAGPD
jgi:hypothetical protein